MKSYTILNVVLLGILLLSGCSEVVEEKYITQEKPVNNSKFLYESDPTYLRTNFLLSYFSPGTGTKSLNYKVCPFFHIKIVLK